MFLSLIVSIYGFIKSALPVRKAIVDDYPFKLCYIFTAALLFFFTSLLGLKDAFSKYFYNQGRRNEFFRDQPSILVSRAAEVA